MNEKYSAGKDYKIIAMIVACFSMELQQEMIQRMTAKAKENNCRVIFFSTLSDGNTDNKSEYIEENIFDLVAVERFDAIVLMAESFKNTEDQITFVKRAKKAGTPVFTVDHPLEGCINISFDYQNAFCGIVRHMVEHHGYRRIKFMSGIPNNTFSEERLNAYKHVLLENGMTFDPKDVYYGYFWENPTKDAMKQMLEECQELPEAIICANDMMAIAVCSFLKEKGYRVPEDIAVSGFDGVDTEKYHTPRLLTSRFEPNAFFDQLFIMINDPGLKAEEKEIRLADCHKIQIGGSCGCPKLESLDATAKIVEMQSKMYEQMEYQRSQGSMVATYGNAEGMDIIQTVIPLQLKNMSYYDFWFCSKERVLIADYPSYAKSAEETKKEEVVNSIYYANYGDKTDIKYIERIPRTDLIADLPLHTESEHPLLVVSVPIRNDRSSYAVIKIDAAWFWFTAYSSFIFHFRFLLELQNSKRKLMHVYNTDSLTGLYNRGGFYRKMEQVLEYAKVDQITVISLDMCKFKQINDTYGHAEGDIALGKVGEIIRSSITNREIAARIGGDEFLIALFREDAETQKKQAEDIVSKLNQYADQFNEQNEKDYQLIFSVGICTECVTGHSLDYFLTIADQRMYEHKYRQKNDEA